MKKRYSTLEIEVILLDACDILTLSNGGVASSRDNDVVIDNLNSLIGGN